MFNKSIYGWNGHRENGSVFGSTEGVFEGLWLREALKWKKV